ncbi:MAG: radical SAM protein, partial [Sulfolobales archaeon]|nr:radical SAM protein [Sulfolobales archaeon]
KFIDSKNKPKDLDINKILYQIFVKHDYDALGKFHMKTLFIGMMHFMDLYNYDIERVKRCCIHYVMTDNRVVPFCAFNVIPEWYRDCLLYT